MKKLTKLMSLALAGMMLLSTAGCGEKTEEMPTLKWYLPGTEQADQASVNAKINEILEKEAGCHLDIEYMEAGVYAEKMQMNMASNNPYDLCFTGYVNKYQDAAQKGGLLNLDEYIKKSEIIKETIPQYALDAAKVGGSVYAIPNLQIMATANGLFIQKDLFEEWGQLKIEDVKTVLDIEPFLQWVKETHPEKYPAKAPMYTGWGEDNGYELLSEVATGVDIIQKDGKIYADNAVKLAGKLYRAEKQSEYFQKGYYRQDLAVAVDESNDDKANKYAAWIGVYKPGADIEASVSRGIDILCVPVTEAKLVSGAGRTTMTAIGKNSKYPDKAFKIIELMNSNKELYNLVCYGIEGKHYKMTDEKHVEMIADSGYDPGMSWRFGNQFNALLLPGQADDVWEKTIEFNDSAKVSPIIDFTFDNKSIRTEIAQIETVFGKYQAFNKGFLPMEDYYDEFVSELEKAGIQKIIDEVNKQLDEYFKNK